MPNGGGAGGRGLVALSLDSKAISQYTNRGGGPGAEPKSTRANALRNGITDVLARSTTSAGRHSRQVTKQQGLFSNSQMVSNLGRLPTLGLNQIKLEEFHDQDNNLYRLQPTTEKMLVARELEREFKDLNKFEKDNLRVWQKGISTRIDRSGTIRVVNAIPASKPDGDKKKGLGAKDANSQEELKQGQG